MKSYDIKTYSSLV